MGEIWVENMGGIQVEWEKWLEYGAVHKLRDAIQVGRELTKYHE